MLKRGTNIVLAIYLFYDQARGKQDKYAFSNRFRHLDIYTYLHSAWLVHRFGSGGIEYQLSRFKDGSSIISHCTTIQTITRIVAVNIDKRATFLWRPLWSRTCNELARYLTAVDIGFTYSPRHFYSKLLEYDCKTNYQILSIWRRDLWDTGVAITRTNKTHS